MMGFEDILLFKGKYTINQKIVSSNMGHFAYILIMPEKIHFTIITLYILLALIFKMGGKNPQE